MDNLTPIFDGESIKCNGILKVRSKEKCNSEFGYVKYIYIDRF